MHVVVAPDLIILPRLIWLARNGSPLNQTALDVLDILLRNQYLIALQLVNVALASRTARRHPHLAKSIGLLAIYGLGVVIRLVMHLLLLLLLQKRPMIHIILHRKVIN